MEQRRGYAFARDTVIGDTVQDVRSSSRPFFRPFFPFVFSPACSISQLPRRLYRCGAAATTGVDRSNLAPTRCCLVRKKGETASPKRDKPQRVSVRDESLSVLNLESKKNAVSFRAKDTNSTLRRRAATHFGAVKSSP